MDFQSIGKVMLVGGIVLAVLGGLFLLLGQIPALRSFGSLPGDIRIERPGFSCFVPIGSMIVLSILLSIVLNIIIRLINRQ